MIGIEFAGDVARWGRAIGVSFVGERLEQIEITEEKHPF